MPHMPLVTIAIPVLNEARLLPGLLDALGAQTWSDSAMQIIIVDGGSEDETPEIARKRAADFSDFILIPNRDRIAAAGLNKALVMARGGYLLRLDARSRPASDYIERCVAHLESGRWAGVGGPQVAVGENKAGWAIALALNHPFGTGNPRYRRRDAATESDTIYLGAYDMDWLRRVDGWDDAFIANEDYELNARLRKAGAKLLVAPDVRVQYIARDHLKTLARQYASYGFWRCITWRKHPDAMRPRHLAPALLLAFLVVTALLAPLTSWPFVLLATLYLLVVTLVAVRLAWRHGWSLFPRIWLAFPVIHFSWGAGFWWSVMKGCGHSLYK